MNGLVTASTGRVLVDGHDVAHEGREVRRRVGFCFTDPAAQLVMPTALEDVALSLRRTHRKKEARRRAALAILESYGLADLADRSVHSLSGGSASCSRSRACSRQSRPCWWPTSRRRCST